MAKKITKEITETGRVVVTSSFNNTIVTITNTKGDTISWSSSGTVGFKGSRKSTPYAATLAASEASKKALEMGVRRVSVFLKGPGSGRDAAVKALRTTGLHITTLADITKIPHNGCRPKNRRKG
ncbi:30S ribosomal protein S11 [candidate division WWE3 bacterium RIFCSPLOWO2_01_FULL_42_11]|uniref:Small ribosomal subunit protein uS11 n=1 Tax=candidate division WWE3 bacterium RIFCSPLOWO2_01_FULL_42_11 TaxID=1802627 RepID=A0A1F4VS19_UNCKA|nr:MAG: 30S ribosomal protein S11 [candidate division WWE3 bacterium RIFCSPLOWO2_01_FULL_42_11]